MDRKRLVNRTAFFIAICLVITLIAGVFGDINSLVGVAIVVIALMMLQRDLSVRPVWNTCMLSLFTCILGLGAFVSLINPFLGILVNIAIVMITVSVTVQDISTPLHFPFILGYAFMLSVPVTLEELPIRILALIAGSVATVALNVIVNRNRMAQTSHNAIVSMCDCISEGAVKVSAGEKASVTELEKLCSTVNSQVYDRLRDRFFGSSRDATVVDVTSSLMSLGRTVFEKERDLEVLRDISSLMNSIKSFEQDERSIDETVSDIDAFIKKHHQADFAIISSLRTVSEVLRELSSEVPPKGKELFTAPKGGIIRKLKDGCRRDSVTFTFAVRMALMFSLWAFIWDYWDLENAKWLLYTTAAIVMPYTEGTWKKSSMRIAGTLVGALCFAAVALFAGGDAVVLSMVLMAVSYVYTVLDPKRYDIMMIFVTFLALMAASLADPRGDVLIERVVFILLGVFAAMMANMLILPYRLKDENIALGRRYMKVSAEQIESLRRTAAGEPPRTDDSYMVMKASNISSKMQNNDRMDPEHPFGGFIGGQNALTSECNMLLKSIASAGAECRGVVAKVLDHDAPDDVPEKGLSAEESEIVRRALHVKAMFKENRDMLADAVLALPE